MPLWEHNGTQFEQHFECFKDKSILVTETAPIKPEVWVQTAKYIGSSFVSGSGISWLHTMRLLMSSILGRTNIQHYSTPTDLPTYQLPSQIVA